MGEIPNDSLDGGRHLARRRDVPENCRHHLSQGKVPRNPLLWRAIEKAAIAAVQEGGEHFAGGDELGAGAISYFMSDPTRISCIAGCRVGACSPTCYPEVHTKVSYRYNAINERGKDCVVMFPAKVGVPMNRVQVSCREDGRETAQDVDRRSTGIFFVAALVIHGSRHVH
jgi:hypothetical protein